MQAEPLLGMGTLASPAGDSDDLFRGDVVKVVCDREGTPLYFSRSPIRPARVSGPGSTRPV